MLSGMERVRLFCWPKMTPEANSYLNLVFLGAAESLPDVRSRPDSASALVLRNQDSAVARLPDSAAGAFKCFILAT